MFRKLERYITRQVNYIVGIKKAKTLGISFYKPNYIYLQILNSNSIVVDVGCADDPDFSIHVIKTFNCRSYGVDPTTKHFDSLKKVEYAYMGKFIHLPYAVANKNGKIIFYESTNETSGSILLGHANIREGHIMSYEVEAKSIGDIKSIVGGKIDFLKLDLEGAEYSLLSNMNPNDYIGINQIFIEFHHHCIEGITIEDTKNIVNNIINIGYKSFSIDQHNFLFYR